MTAHPWGGRSHVTPMGRTILIGRKTESHRRTPSGWRNIHGEDGRDRTRDSLTTRAGRCTWQTASAWSPNRRWSSTIKPVVSTHSSQPSDERPLSDSKRIITLRECAWRTAHDRSSSDTRHVGTEERATTPDECS